MQLPYRTFVRIARIGAADARRIGGHGADLLADLGFVFAQADGVAVGLGHLLPVQPRHAGGRCEHGLRLGQDHLAAAFEVAEQAFAVAQAQALLFIQQRLGGQQRFAVALLLEARAQLAIQFGFLAAQLLDRGFRLLFEARLRLP